jgi:hypothetical protein
MKVFTTSFFFLVRHSFRLPLIAFYIIFLSLFVPSISFPSELLPIRTLSTGYQPQFQVSGNKIHFVWHEYGGPYRQIFTAEMNIDGTAWKAEKRTAEQFDKVFPQLLVAGNKIYTIWQQPDATKNRQIWTAEMSIDGKGWKEVQRTNTPFDKQFPQLQAFEDMIYCTWNESDGKYRQIWTAEMNLGGTGRRAMKRTSTPFNKFEPQLQVVGDKIYFVWREFDGSHFQIWTAVMNRDGTGWNAVKQTNSPYDKHNPQFQMNGGRIYLAWHEADGQDWRKARYQIWTAVMNVDGTGWQTNQRTIAGFDKYTPQLQVTVGKIYYVWEESDGKHRQIWTAVTNKDGTGWISEKRTRSPYGKYDPQFQIVEDKAYYVWHEDHGPTEPIWVAIETLK